MKKYNILLFLSICILLFSGCADKEKSKENDICVYVMQNSPGNRRVTYADTGSFLRDFGFAQAEPFFEYRNSDGVLQLTLYYDEQSESGCGIRYYEKDPTMFFDSGLYGFTFEGIYTKEWGGWDTDYHEVPVSPIFSDEGFLEDCHDNYVYDEQKRIIQVVSTGVIIGTGDTESSTLLQIDYTYGENGLLQHRLYRHNMFVAGTYGAVVDSSFDEQERLLYEYRYVTHGSEDYYYIYEVDGKIPVYCLMLDFNTGDWIPELTKYR